jgi:hypothetical protein
VVIIGTDARKRQPVAFGVVYHGHQASKTTTLELLLNLAQYPSEWEFR